MCFLYSSQVVAAMVRKAAARQGRLEQVGGIARAGRAARADQRVGLVNKQNDRLGRRLHFFNDLAQPLLKFALHARAGLQQADVKRAHADVLRAPAARRPPTMRWAKPSTTAVLPTPASPVRMGLFWRRRMRMSTQLADFLVAADDGIDLAFAGLFGQIDGETGQRLLFAHGRGRHRPAGFAGRGAGAQTGAVGGGHGLLRRTGGDGGKFIGQRSGLILANSRESPRKTPLIDGRFEQGINDMAGSHLGFAKEQSGVKPSSFDGFLQMGREVLDRSGAARQSIQRRRQIGGQTGGDPRKKIG